MTIESAKHCRRALGSHAGSRPAAAVTAVAASPAASPAARKRGSRPLPSSPQTFTRPSLQLLGRLSNKARRSSDAIVGVLPTDPSGTAADMPPPPSRPGDFGGPEEELALISFHIPVASPTTDPANVVLCPDIRDMLLPRDSPLLQHDNFGGGFVDDEDRISLNTMRLSSVASSGATDMCVDLPNSRLLDLPDDNGPALAWPVTRPVPTLPGGGGDDGRRALADATSRIDGGHMAIRGNGAAVAAKGRAAPSRARGGVSGTAPPSQQQQRLGGISAIAARVPAAAAAAAARSLLSGDGGGSAHILQLHNVSTLPDRVCVSLPSWAMRAGPRKRIFFDPARVTAAIVTCGHICPGVNDVVQAIVHRLTDYGVPEGQALGICDGFKGFDPRHPAKPRPLTRHVVEGAHLRGGSLLGTSKGWADINAVVHKIAIWDVDMLFVVGGDGGLRAAQLISEQCRARGLPCCVVGVPKSIENDILLVDRTFGFETAVQEVQRPLLAAKVEASSIRGGIGLVKIMGRHSGFLAMQASLASGVVDVCLIPEVSFTLDGPHGLLAYLGSVLERKGHAVVCVAEGAGQDLINSHTPLTKDLLGNPVLHDIGVYLKARFKMHFKDAAEVRYIDPTYMIRTTPCNSMDHIYARVLAHNAVDAAFSGYTGVTVGMCNNHHVMLPIPLVVQAPRRVDPWGMAWNRLRADSGQPSFHPPPALGRTALSSTTETETETEAEAGTAFESAISTGSFSSPAESLVDATITAAAAAAVADADAAATAGGGKATANDRRPAPLLDETDIMTSLAGEPAGPQDSMSPDSAAGSQGLYGGGAAISPPPPRPADVTGKQLSVLATEPEQAILPWPSPPPMPYDSSTATGETGGVGVHVGRSIGASGSSMDGGAPPPAPVPAQLAGTMYDTAPATKSDIMAVGCGGGVTGAAAAATEEDNRPSQAPASAPAAGEGGTEPESTVPAEGHHGGPLGALGAVLRSVTGGPSSGNGSGGDGGGGGGGGAGSGSGNGGLRKGSGATDGAQRQDGGDRDCRTASPSTPPPSPSRPPKRSSREEQDRRTATYRLMKSEDESE